MGQLKPGATYVYERHNGQVWARESGSKERILIGWDEETQKGLLWREIPEAAKTNPALQKAVDRVIMLYKLSKETYE